MFWSFVTSLVIAVPVVRVVWRTRNVDFADPPRKRFKLTPLSFEDAITAAGGVFPPHSSPAKFTYSLRDRSEQLGLVADLVKSNWQRRGNVNHNYHNFLIVPGASGIGKTRFGFEVLRLIEGLSPSLTQQENDVRTIVSKYICVDFNNGERFDPLFDSEVGANLRLGVRLAAKGLLKAPFLGPVLRRPEVYQAFQPLEVLGRVVSDALKDHESAAVALVLHFDEFQAYVDEFGNLSDGRTALKHMLRFVGDFMRTGLQGGPLDGRFFVVPVLTGTAANDVKFLRTDRYREQIVLLDPLSESSALAMFEEKFGKRPEIYQRSHFRVALSDTGFIPRIIDFLYGVPASSLRPNVDWGSHLQAMYLKDTKRQQTLDLELYGGAASAEAIIHFALSAQTVRRDFVLPGGQVVGELERRGELFLVPVNASGGFRIWLPFVQLAALNQLLIGAGCAAFEQSLLFSPSATRPWRWQDFEELHAQFQALRMKSLLAAQDARLAAATALLAQLEAKRNEIMGKQNDLAGQRILLRIVACQSALDDLKKKVPEGFSLAQVCPGATGHPETLARRVMLQPVRCYHEQHKWIRSTCEAPDVDHSVTCKEGVFTLVNGVFLCAPGTANFDGRFVCLSADGGKPVLFAWQDKHTQLAANTGVTAEFIVEWHKQSSQCLQKWVSQYDVVYLFLTNRRLTGTDAARLDDIPGLLVVTREQLTKYLSPTLVGRGLIPRDIN